MRVEAITEADDEQVADYRQLNEPSVRRALEGDRLFIAEGPVALQRLVASGHRIRSVLIDERKLGRLVELDGVVDGLGDAPVFTTTRPLLREIVGFDLHRGVVAAADRRPLANLDEVLATTGRLRLAVLEGLNDPENVGAVARSARAFGVDALVLDATCTDPYARRTVRVSMGEVLHLRVVRCTDLATSLTAMETSGVETWAMSPALGAADLWELEVPERLAVVLGAEGPGLHRRTIERCARAVRIPIRPDVDSLNVGAAAAVTFAAAAR